jgi:hypothetical protein
MRAPDFLLGLLDAITAGYALIVLALQGGDPVALTLCDDGSASGLDSR